MSVPPKSVAFAELQPGQVIQRETVDVLLGFEAHKADFEAQLEAFLEHAETLIHKGERQGYEEGVAHVAAKVTDFAGELERQLDQRIDRLEDDLLQILVSTLDEILGSP